MDCKWQHVMNCFDPVAFTIGSFQIYWYALFFLLAWQVSFQTLLFIERRKKNTSEVQEVEWHDLAWIVLLGAFLGGRLGFVFFYAPEYFLTHISEVFIPYNFSTQTWTTISGMSFHGGLMGAGLSLYYYSWKNKISFFSLSDTLVLVVPVASFFGRVGNFLNQELPGKVTTLNWGIYFPYDQWLRHPVTLYSSLFEGIFLFGWMLYWRKYLQRRGDATFFYIFSYGVVRFILEFWREPDSGVVLLFDILSRGQLLSIILIFGALLYWFLRSKYATIEST